LHLLTEVKSTAVATGFCDKLGNKGGIAITLKIGKTKLCFLTAHLSAHQNQMSKRIAEFTKISREVSRAFGNLEKSNQEMIDESTSTSCSEDPGSKPILTTEDCFEDDCPNDRFQRDAVKSKTNITCSFCSSCSKSIRQCSLCCCPNRRSDKYNPLLDVFDHIIWGGDFNFRIHGTRGIVDTLLSQNRCDVLLDNDQLTMLMQYERVFRGFNEGPVTFRPTYKFDRGSGMYLFYDLSFVS
jgi:hypothetical protein